ncbi:MAG: trypsin-like serine protease [Burkholderiaceae bacterium]
MVNRLSLPALCLVIVMAMSPLGEAWALMAGRAPDSADRRIDPNRLDSPWAGVGSIKVLAGVFSGVLVDRRFVLTAAHVVHGAEPSGVHFVLNLDEGGGLYLPVRRVHVHPSYRGFTLPFAYFDLALLELQEPAPDRAPVYPMAFSPLKPGTPLRFVGYGGSGNGDTGPGTPPGVSTRRVGGNHADRFVPLPGSGGRQAMFLFDFDADGVPNRMGTQRLPNDVETTPSLGDSGAPAFIDDGWRPALVGLITFVADAERSGVPRSTFGSIGGGVLLGPSREWILRTIGSPADGAN